MSETIFSKIIRREVPCYKIYEDDLVLAFLDIGPLSRGHALVIPKEPAVMLHELSESSSAAIGKVLPRICRAVMTVAGASAYNILQNNGTLAHQAVAHVHFHVIPKFSEQSGLGIRWNSGSLSALEGAELAEAIAKELLA